MFQCLLIRFIQGFESSSMNIIRFKPSAPPSTATLKPSQPSSKSPHPRKSSLGMRGKRISASFEATGVICKLTYSRIFLRATPSMQPIHIIPYPIAVFTNTSIATYLHLLVLVSCLSGAHHALCLKRLNLSRKRRHPNEKQKAQEKTLRCRRRLWKC